MEGLTNVIQIQYADKDINKLIEELPVKHSSYTRHFTYNEDFFVKLQDDFTVPHFPIHHDVRKIYPEKNYLKALKELFNTLFSLTPEIFSGLVYFFDPGEILRPGFFKLFKIEKKEFLYLLRLDLLYKAQYSHIEERGDNDVTPEYRTNALFLQANFLPLKEIIVKQGKVEALVINQKISETWIGEQGRGYLLKGIWIDDELSRFFTKLFLPPGKKIYPYYPFLCMYKTLCSNVIDPGMNERERILPLLHNALRFLSPYMRKIEKALKNTLFSEDLPLFQEIKALVSPEWIRMFENIRIEVYLNQNDSKEFRIDRDG
ncbi:MAG: hypothetical protein JXB88_27285 [Spirochaetales bacterium]|nr:hypothetical protein [Spirochaetales bacterium]